MVGVVNSQGLQQPVESTQLAEEGIPAETEETAIRDCRCSGFSGCWHTGKCFAHIALVQMRTLGVRGLRGAYTVMSLSW